MILGVKVEKCVKNVTKNQQIPILEDAPRSRGSHWGLVVLSMYWPLMYPIQPCATQIFSLAECVSPATIFRKKLKNRYDAGSGAPPLEVPRSYVLATGAREKLAFLGNLVFSPEK